MEGMIQEYIKSILRTLAGPVIVWLVAKGYVTESQATEFIVAGIAVLVGVVWSLGNKYLWGKKVEKALELPAGSSKATLNDILKRG